MASTDFVVVGAGHGGLISAAKLARAGFTVQVLERATRDTISWDWYDNLDGEIFQRVGMPSPTRSEYLIPENYTFVSPLETTKITTDTPPEEREITMDRGVLVRKLLDWTHDAGADIKYRVDVKNPLVTDGKLVGVNTSEGEVRGNFIIDAAGINTPIRPNLPNSFQIMPKPARGEVFYTYRALFNKTEDLHEFKVYFAHAALPSRGITWVNTSTDQYADILIGQIDPLTQEDVTRIIDHLRKKNPVVGEEILRGGQFSVIPVRRTIPRLVAPNYAAVGDSACMTIPLIGSGIENAMIAGDLLADRLVEVAKTNLFNNVPALWRYQYDYFLERGAKMAGIDYLKNFMMVASLDDIDFLLRKRVITAKDMAASRGGKEVDMGFVSLIGRVFRGFSRLGVLLDVKKVVDRMKSVEAITKGIPEKFETRSVILWEREIQAPFEIFRQQLSSPPN